MNRNVCAAALAILVGGFCPVLGQSVSFDVGRPLPGQFGFDELWNITLHNLTTDTQTVYLHVEASVALTGPVFVANTQEFKLAPGDRSLRAADIKLSDVWREKGFEAFATSGKVLPEGTYAYNITLVPQMSEASLTLHVVAPKPLDVVWPKPGARVADSLPVFVWTRPVIPRYAGDFLYSVRVAEMQAGKSCTLATESPATIVEHCRSSALAWRYSEKSPRLVPGNTYAWRVEA